MKRSYTIWIIVILVVVVAGAIWVGYYMNNAPAAPYNPPANVNMAANTPVAPTPDTTSGTKEIILHSVTNAKLGDYLTDAGGMTLYYFTNDSADTDTCTGACATIWPPYIVNAGFQLVGDGKATGTIGTIKLINGATQLTYNHAPLYRYIKDTAPLQTNGQGVGGIWFVQKP